MSDEIMSRRSSLFRRLKFATLVGLFALTFLSGYAVHRKKLTPHYWIESAYFRFREWIDSEDYPAGYWRYARQSSSAMTREQEDEVRKLASLGYLPGTRTGSLEGGVTVHEPQLARQGMNLYSSGHGPEAILMDMDGRVRHRWRMPYRKVFPNAPPPAEDQASAHYWRRVHLYPNGDLIAIFDGLGILMLDRDSKVLWSLDNASHHDISVAENGAVYTLTRIAHMIPELNEHKPILEDFITLLSRDGVEQEHYSVLDALRNSDFSTLLEHTKNYGDLLHTNALQILDARHEVLSPLFKEGNALVSMPGVDTIAVIDLEANRVVWAMTGMFDDQHDPTMLENGNVLLFDNHGRGGRSRVLEIDALTLEVVSRYPAEIGLDLYTQFCGAAQRLPNGNTLITESEAGRAIEITIDNHIVWEFRTPHRAGKGDELIASLMDMQRVPVPEFLEADN